MNLNIVTPDGEIFKSEVSSIIVTSNTGEFAILKDRLPIVSSIANGHIKINILDDKILFCLVYDGLLEYSNNEISILCQFAVTGDSLEELETVKEAKLKDIKNHRRKDKVETTKLEKELNENIKKSKAGRL